MSHEVDCFAQVTWKFWRAGKGHEFVKGMEFGCYAMCPVRMHKVATNQYIEAKPSCHSRVHIFTAATVFKAKWNANEQTQRWRPMILEAIIFGTFCTRDDMSKRTCRRSIPWPSITQRNEKKQTLAVSSGFHYIHIICLDFHNEGFLALFQHEFPGHFQWEKKIHTWHSLVDMDRAASLPTLRLPTLKSGDARCQWFLVAMFFCCVALVGEIRLEMFFFVFFLWVIFFCGQDEGCGVMGKWNKDVDIWQLGCYLVRYWTLMELIEGPK